MDGFLDKRPRLPVAFRFGAIGAGIGVGCGIGVGIGQPIDLAGVPAVGSAARGLSNGLASVDGMLGGVSRHALQLLRRLPLPGVQAGVGCGVGIGYGFGAGLMLQPAAAEQLAGQAKQLAGVATQRVEGLLSKAGIKLGPGPAAADQSNTAGGGVDQAAAAAAAAALPQHAFLPPFGTPAATPAQPPTPGSAQKLDDLSWLVIQQQRQIQELQQEAAALKSAVCELQPSAPVCSGSSAPGTRQ